MSTIHSRSRAGTCARGGLLALAALATVSTGYAQGEGNEEVVVTGSRIARGSDFENPSPVVTDRKSVV